MRTLAFFSFLFFLATGQASGQTLEEALETHKEELAVAKAVVESKWQELLVEALSKNDQALAGEYRDWSNAFQNEGAMFMPVKDSEMSLVYKGYGSAIKKAGDKLREAYLAEIKRLTVSGEKDEATARLNELTELRLPGRLVSIQPYRSTVYVNHFGWVFRAGQVKAAGEKMNATFEETSGLSTPGLLSLRPISVPNMFLAHHGFRVNLQAFAEDPTWKLHATWLKLPGLSDAKKGCSFQSVSHPDRYIRVRANGELWLDKFEESARFRSDVTFYNKRPLYPFWPSE